MLTKPMWLSPPDLHLDEQVRAIYVKTAWNRERWEAAEAHGLSVDTDFDKLKDYTLTNLFLVRPDYNPLSPPVEKRFEDMTDEEMLEALALAGRVGRRLEAQGVKVNY